MNLELLVQPLFNHSVIHQYARMVDNCFLSARKCNDLIDQLLHFIRNAVDLASPVDREQRKIYEYIESLKS